MHGNLSESARKVSKIWLQGAAWHDKSSSRRSQTDHALRPGATDIRCSEYLCINMQTEIVSEAGTCLSGSISIPRWISIFSPLVTFSGKWSSALLQSTKQSYFSSSNMHQPITNIIDFQGLERWFFWRCNCSPLFLILQVITSIDYSYDTWTIFRQLLRQQCHVMR